MNLKGYITKGKVSLFLIALLLSLLFGVVGYLISDRLTAVTMSAIGGTLSILSISTIADLIGFALHIGKSSGVLGTCLGTLLILLI